MCPLNEVPGFRQLSCAERDFMRQFKAGEVQLAPGQTLLQQGGVSDSLYTVLAGWGFRAKTLPDGCRQILNFVLPGDLVGLQSSVFEEAQHSVEALTKMRLCIFPRSRLWSLYRDHPSLALDVTWLAARQEFLMDENLTSLGCRSARERLAFLLSWLHHRATEVGLAEDNELELPLTQQHAADALGLSLVHTNKTLQRMSREGMVEWKKGRLTIRDTPALHATAHWDPTRTAARPFI